MSTKYQCNACGGIYPDTQPDGTLYFHACGYVIDPKTGIAAPPANARNENITIAKDWKASGIVAAGAGVKPVGQVAAADPAWLNQLNTQLAKEA